MHKREKKTHTIRTVLKKIVRWETKEILNNGECIIKEKKLILKTKNKRHRYCKIRLELEIL